MRWRADTLGSGGGAACLVCLALLAAGAPAAAAGGDEKRPLPAFQVMALEGASIESSQLGPAGQWLIVYVTPDSPASIRLLQGMKPWETPDLALRTIVIVGADVADTAALAQGRAEQFPAVRWFADPQGEAWKALRLTGTPCILGVRDGLIVWSLAGVLNDPKALESVLRGWVGQRPGLR